VQLSPMPRQFAIPGGASRSARTARRVCVRLAICIGLGLLSSCGGGIPLLHPASALAPGRTAFSAGVSDHFVLGDEQRALNDARNRVPEGAPGDPPFDQGVLVAVAEGPALSPFVSARAGIPGSNEAGLSYTGRALRGEARHAFEWDQSALSLGLGLTARAFGQSTLEVPGTDLRRASGWGVDLPILYGYRTDPELISIWGGLRGSFDHWAGSLALDAGERFKLGASRLALGPVLGLAVGVPPFAVAVELEVDCARVAGSLDRAATHYDVQLGGWSAHPAGALVAKF
jgi:hypothetical protein